MSRYLQTILCLIITALLVVAPLAQHAKKMRVEPGIKTVYGKINTITVNRVVVENDEGATRSISFDDKTKFKNAQRKTLKLTNMQLGMYVAVTYRESDMTARLVQEVVKKNF